MSYTLPTLPATADALPSAETKILALPELLALRQVWRLKDQPVVFTNGCFDILHVGHVDYLARARALGKRLVLGLNTDASVRRLKGHARPINPEAARARVLAALECVDAVVLFDEDTPLRLIQAVKPDILCKGGDYTFETIVGADLVQAYGGQVAVLPFVDGFSTTQTIERMKQ